MTDETLAWIIFGGAIVLSAVVLGIAAAVRSSQISQDEEREWQDRYSEEDWREDR